MLLFLKNKSFNGLIIHIFATISFHVHAWPNTLRFALSLIFVQRSKFLVNSSNKYYPNNNNYIPTLIQTFLWTQLTLHTGISISIDVFQTSIGDHFLRKGYRSRTRRVLETADRLSGILFLNGIPGKHRRNGFSVWWFHHDALWDYYYILQL